MDALAAYGDMNDGGEGGPPRFDIREAPLNGTGVPIGPYMDKRFLGAISSFKTPEPLNDENWVAWKGQISSMLKLNQVWKHCEGPEVALDLDDEWQPIWDTAENVARVLISNNLSAPQFVHISQAATVKQMWENLKSVHEHRGQQSITALRRTLYQAQAKDGDDIVAHLTKMRSIQAQLHQMGSRVPDGDFTNILVSSLPVSWDSFTTSYLGSQTGDKILTSQQFIVIIRNEYNRRKASDGDNTITETALAAQSSKRATKKRKAVDKEKAKKACHVCGQDNHLAKDCFFKGKPKCTNCGCFNHEASECRSTKVEGKSTTDAVTTQNGKRRKVERVQQARDVQEDEDEDMEDSMYVIHDKTLSDYADINVDSWLADSATSSHLLNQRETFTEFTPLKRSIRGVGNTDVPVKGRGTVKLTSQTNGQTITIVIRDVLYVPQAPNNLLSISHLDESGGRADICNGRIHLYDKNKLLIAVGQKVERMYLLYVTAKKHTEHTAISTETANTWQSWHRRFGHVGVSGLQRMLNKNLVTGMMVDKNDSLKIECTACIQAKQAHNPFPRQSEHRAEKPGDLTHTDLWECRTTGIHGLKYFISFVDDCSRCVAIEFLKTKDQATKKFKNYVAYLE